MDTLQTTIVDTLYLISKSTGSSSIDIINLIKDIIIIIISGLGVCVAYGGLKTWRKQLKGKSEYETAKKLLRSVYEVRESVRIVRNPLIGAGEIQKAFDDENLSFDNSKQDLVVYQKRWKIVADALSKLNVEVIEAEVVLGKDIKQLIDRYCRIINDLRFELNIFLELGLKGIREEYGKEKVKEIRNIIYEISEDPEKDEYTRRVQESIQDIEDFLKIYIKLLKAT